MVVAGHQQHAAMRRGAGMVGVAEHVAAAVHAGALAVPEGEHAIVFRALQQRELLGAPDGGGGQFLVDARAELDVLGFELLARVPHLDIDLTERRAAIAGDEAGGVEAGGEIELALQHGQAHQSLRAREVEAGGVELVFVVERDCRMLHVTRLSV